MNQISHTLPSHTTTGPTNVADDISQIAAASSLLHLAADPSVMRKVPYQPDYAVNVVYLGQFKNTKHRLVEVRAAEKTQQENDYILRFLSFQFSFCCICSHAHLSHPR